MLLAGCDRSLMHRDCITSLMGLLNFLYPDSCHMMHVHHVGAEHSVGRSAGLGAAYDSVQSIWQSHTWKALACLGSITLSDSSVLGNAARATAMPRDWSIQNRETSSRRRHAVRHVGGASSPSLCTACAEQ